MFYILLVLHNFMATTFYPLRGTLVAYDKVEKGEILYYQPNGTFGYLYEFQQDIGLPKRAKYEVRRWEVRRPTSSEVENVSKKKSYPYHSSGVVSPLVKI